MDAHHLKDKLVAILGYGKEGMAVTAYLLKHGVTPVLFDQRPWDDWQEIEKLEIKKLGVNFIFGPDAFKELKGFDVAFRSPGVKLGQVTSNKLLVTSQTKFFFEHCPAKIIGVTGTKGKGTTASLIYEILSVQSKIFNHKSKIYLTGNIGKTQALDILDDLKPDDWVVYELSSFQLQDLDRSPHIGIVLMVTSEHLDYHQDQREYIEAKSAITKFQTADDLAIVNIDYENSAAIGKQGSGKKLYFSTIQHADSHVQGDTVYLKDQPLLNTGDLQLKGRHNLQNVCAAVLAADAAGCGADDIKTAVAEFNGLEHRLEFVAEKNGIKYYNDSFSTTPETAIAAINAFQEPEILILGGSSKNSDFNELGKAIAGKKNIKAIILIGEEALKIENAISSAGAFGGQLIKGAKSMEEIFTQISSAARKGDIVLLSPACASFDMFENYEDRGNQFKEQVERLG